MSILTLKVPELIRGIIRGAGEGTIVFSPTLFIFSVSGGKEPLKNGGETRIPWYLNQESDCFAACVQFATLQLKG